MITQSPLSPRCFTDEAIFAAEQATLIERTWQFAGLSSDVLEDKDFITGTIGTQPFVIQNFHGRLAALHNVCTHRSAPLQNEERGNRGLYCAYHGWTFDSKGVPVGIPHNDAHFSFKHEEVQCLAAKSFGLEKLGNLMFVSAGAQGTLGEQLGEHFALLSRIGDSLDDVSFRTRIHAACNWKLLIHNAYDDIHAQFVHPKESLDTSEYLSSSWKTNPFDMTTESIPKNYSQRHALFSVQMSQSAQENNRSLFEGKFRDPVFSFDDYLHLVIFPNLMITSVQGLWYNIVHYRPTSQHTTELDLWVIPSRQRDGVSRATPEMLYRLALGTLRIFQEDVEAVESSQRHIASVQRHAPLGKREDKIYAFDAACVSALRGVGIDATA